MHRRKYLALTGLAASGALAGCGGNEDGSNQPDENVSVGTDDGESNVPEGREGTFQLREFSVPDSADVGEEIEISGVVENTSDERAIYSETVAIGFSDYEEPDEWEEFAIETGVDADSAGEWSLESFTADRPSRVFVRLGDDIREEVIDVPPELAPYVTTVAPVEGWEEFGDIEESTIRQAPAGSTVDLAFRYWYYSEDGQRSAIAQITVFGPEGDAVGRISQPLEDTVEENGWGSWEQVIPVATEGADPGEYVLELVLVDSQSGAESDARLADLELVAPEETSE